MEEHMYPVKPNYHGRTRGPPFAVLRMLQDLLGRVLCAALVRRNVFTLVRDL